MSMRSRGVYRDKEATPADWDKYRGKGWFIHFVTK